VVILGSASLAMVLTCQDCGRQYWLRSGEQQWLARKCKGSSRNMRCVQCEAAGIPAFYHGVRLDIGLGRKPTRPQSASASTPVRRAERLPHPIPDFDSASQASSVAWNCHKLGYTNSSPPTTILRANGHRVTAAFLPTPVAQSSAPHPGLLCHAP